MASPEPTVPQERAEGGGTQPTRTARSTSRSGVRWLLPALVAAAAFLVRLRLVTNGGGLHGLQGYDDGVYYTAADALLHGRWPYRDFVLLHPPGIVVALAPFAALGRLTSDATGIAVARLAFMAVGAFNAAAVCLLARRCGPVAAVVAGLLYAAWYPAAYAERVTLIEPLGTATLLAGLLLLRGDARRWTQVAAGAALGGCLAMKIWDVVPVLVVIGWAVVTRRVRPLRLLAGAGAAVTMLYLPFLLAAPRLLPQMVVLDQVARPARAHNRLLRLTSMSGLTLVSAHVSAITSMLLTLATAVLVIACTVVALLRSPSSLWGLLLLACTTVLLTAPSYYLHYGGFIAGPLALVVGAAAARAAGTLSARSHAVQRHPALVTAPAILALVALALSTASVGTGQRFPGPSFARLAANRGCVVADDPTALALMDVLSRDLAAGCPLMVDVSGLSYDRDAELGADRLPVRRPQNQRYQQDVYAYLTSGGATVLARRGGNGFSPATRRRLNRLPVLNRAQGATLAVPSRTIEGRARHLGHCAPAPRQTSRAPRSGVTSAANRDLSPRRVSANGPHRGARRPCSSPRWRRRCSTRSSGQTRPAPS